MTIGERIREIRKFRGYTQTELGEKIGLPADRIRQYENNVRKPKADLLKKIVKALNVNSAAISNIEIKDINDIMHFLFILEDKWGLTINKKDDEYILSFNQDSKKKNINNALDSWYREKKDSIDINTYQNWKYQYQVAKNINNI